MPPVRTAKGRKPPPDGFEDIEDTLLEFSNKMKDAEAASHDGKKRHETVWPIFQISHQRSRYIYDLYYDRQAISKQLYDWLLKNGYADANLIAKWKKQGYENLCCLRCIQTKETNFNSTCICRVPRAQLKEGQTIEEEKKPHWMHKALQHENKVIILNLYQDCHASHLGFKAHILTLGNDNDD